MTKGELHVIYGNLYEDFIIFVNVYIFIFYIYVCNIYCIFI